MAQLSYSCCPKKPEFLITYSVSGSEKNYLVCSDCVKLECFSKYIIRKIPIQDLHRENYQEEISKGGNYA